MKTGFYFRLKRDGKFGPVDILESTKEELTEILKDRPSSFPAEIIVQLCKQIRTDYYKKAKELLRLAYKDDDMMDQDTLFDLQEKAAQFALDIAQAEDKTDDLVKAFPYLYTKKG